MTHTRLINVVDLTGDGEQNENHQRLDPAVSRAFAEAARLTSHFDSWSSRSKPSSSDNIDPREKILTPTLAARPPRLGIFGKTGRPAIKSFQKPENNIAGSGRDSPAFSTGSVVFPTTPGAFEPVTKPPSNTRGSGVKQNKPLETQSAPHRANTSAVRTPRTAAVFAKQNITETCNEMEEWMNRDPKLVPQQAAITTPRKHGRPKKDPDEWSPKSHVSHSIGTPKGLLSVLDYQTPTTGVDTHGSLPVSEYKSLPPAEIVWGHNFARKRKYSDTLQSRQPSAKQVKSEHIPASSQISNPTTRDRFLNTELGSDTRHRSHGSHNSERLTLDSSFLKPAAFVEEVGKVTSLPLHSPKKAGQDAQQFISETSVDPALTTDSHSAIDDILDTVVYPSIKKLKKRHRDSLAQGELNDIGKDIVGNVVSRLKTHPEQTYGPHDDQKKKIKHFVKRLFSQKVRRSMRRAPSLSGPPAKADISVGALSATTPKPERNVSWSSSAVSNGKRAVPRLKAVGSQSTSVNSTMAGVTGNLPFTDKKLNYATRETALKISASIEEQVTTDRIETDSSSVDDFTSYGSGFGVPDLLRVSSRLLPTKSKPEALRKRALKDASFQEQVPQRISCRNPATALDPHLERAIAVFITEIPDRPQKNAQKYLVTPRDRIQLTANQDILKHVDSPFETEKPKLVRIETTVVDPTRRAGRCISSLLRSRELGLDSWGRNVETHGELRLRRIEMIEPWKYWKGASGDIVAVAWAPNSNIYAAGAAAHTNFEDIQYNRPCNLLLGDLSSNTIRELPDHRVDRPKPETIANGPNATRAVYNACDPKVYETITSIGFSVKGDRMFTASHDRTVKVWKFSDGQYQCLRTLHHGAPVTSIEVSKHGSNLFATASKCIENSVRVYYSQDPEDTPCFVNYSSPRAEARPEWRIYPECLRWGSSQHTSHLLLAGFQQWEAECDGPQLEGQLCLWDANAFQSIKVTPGSQSVFATAWHPTLPFFATGGAPKASLVVDKQNTKTVVRTWDLRTPKRYSREYECPALDMQDITFSPIHANIVTAGCTDGSSYIWDARRPDNILHRLQHGRPLADLDHTRSREEADTGVMMSLWSPGGSLFYTGSSDGAIKAWDVRRHPNDVLTNNIAQFGAGIQSGAFSPDGINLLVGDADGAVHVLSSAPCGPRFNSPATEELIELVKAPDGSGLRLEHDEDNPGTEGTEAANALIASGELEYNAEYGVGKGPNYEGPYAKYARKESIEPEIGRLRKKFERVQPFSKHGEKRDVIADRMSCLLSERKVALNHPISTRPQWSNGCVLKPVSDIHDDPVGAIPESEMVEEHHWWPRLGEDEVTRAREKALAGRG